MRHSEHLKASAAVAASVKVQNHSCFAGALSTCLDHVQDSYHAELGGAFLSSKLAYDLLKVNEVCGSSQPEVCFGLDSVTVGNQASGEWHCFADEASGACVRNCQRLIESRFGIRPHFQRTKSHCGDPGNELVDTLAKDAILQTALTPCADWLALHLSRKFCRDAAWFWILFDKEFQFSWHEQCLLFPLPATQPEIPRSNGNGLICTFAAFALPRVMHSPFKE